jgi:hypothetical protein
MGVLKQLYAQLLGDLSTSKCTVQYESCENVTDRVTRVMSMSYHQEPIPKRTPRFRIPGKTLTAAQHDVPSTDATYTAVCQFWLVVFDMNYLYYFERSVSISSAVAIFQRLLGWADALPAGVGRDEHNPDHVLNIQ